MVVEEIKLGQIASATRGLKNVGMFNLYEDAKGGLVVIVARRIRRRWVLFNMPEALWKVTCRSEELTDGVVQVLTERLLAKEKP